MAYARGTATAINPDVKRKGTNPAKVGQAKMVVTQGTSTRITIPVARKPARNKARVA